MTEEHRGDLVSIHIDTDTIAVSCVPGYTEEDYAEALRRVGLRGVKVQVLDAGTEPDGTEYVILNRGADYDRDC
jgi:hypothetical protein